MYMSSDETIYVVVNCNYFIIGLQQLFIDSSINLRFIDDILEIDFPHNEMTYILLVLSITNVTLLERFKNTIDFINGINTQVKTGILVSELNTYLTYYLYRKLKRKVTFFNSHNLINGIFKRNVLSWLKGKTFRPMRVIYRYRDECYGYSLKEWLTLVVPLSGESIKEVSACLNISEHSLYQIRTKALKKMRLQTYREFYQLFINGEMRIENNKIR